LYFKYISDKNFDTFCQNGSLLGEHPDTNINGIKVIGGALGHGIGVASGISYHRAVTKVKSKVYVIIGDGELSEGSNWEAILYILSSSIIKNLVIILDFNKYMTLKSTSDYIRKKNLNSFFKNSNFNFFDIDGHNFNEMNECLKKISQIDNNAFVVLNTYKAKGISFMENKSEWHHKVPNENDFLIAKEELEKKIDKYA